MTRFASSDIQGHTNSECPSGGHYKTIANPKDVAKGLAPEYKEEYLVIDCPVCEPGLVMKDSWSDDELTRPLTRKEQAEAEKLEKAGMREQALMASAMAELAHERVAANAGRGK